ncbi:AAA family ATPase [Ectothiorhodospiraceae bacterium BW-2]|nr:AAA family ATPase [Ectothiorhodospiraceae bacterium BW-2]
MEKFFNTEGPVNPSMHYIMPPLGRIEWPEIEHLLQQQKYFLLHAPRQTGKTTAMLAMVERLNQQGDYHALYANIEAAQTARNDADKGNRIICDTLMQSGELFFNEPLPWGEIRDKLSTIEPQQRLSQLLSWWAINSTKPIVLLLDEVDALIGDTLISLLRQLRAGYSQRPHAFPHSVILCGVRDIKDYRIHQGNGEIITGGSAFNIKAKSLTMGNFTQQEIKTLYQQHTEATGQSFDNAIFDQLWPDTHGQPWLVNALAYQMTWEERELRDRSRPVTLQHYYAARERLIQSRATHLDQLADKLREERVHRVIAPILTGESIEQHDSDLQYCQDLGLIRTRPHLAISNRIYREILPRELTYGLQASIANQEQQWYLTGDNRLNMVKLLQAFQHFFRENAESWIERFDYKEAGPQLLLQAFLQRIINGGGRLNREYALGRRRTDLIIEWPTTAQGYFGDIQRIVIELKILRGELEQIITEGIEQTLDYADKADAGECHLMIFNRNPDTPWDKKIWQQQRSNGQQTITVWGA